MSELSGGDEMDAALIIDEAWIGACDRLGHHRTWSLVQAVADALIPHDSLDGDDFRALVSR